jgi:hypothetical protein
MVHAGCWTRARRGFANAVKLNPGDPVAVLVLVGSTAAMMITVHCNGYVQK